MGATNRIWTFIAILDWYAEDKEATHILVKSNVELEMDVDLDNVLTVMEVCDDEGNIENDKCSIQLTDPSLEYTVKGSKKEVSKIVFGKKSKNIGFKHED
jgi:hypothetical protein